MGAYSSTSQNGNGSINGRGIAHRNLTHRQLVALACDAVAGTHPVVPSLKQVPAIFPNVTSTEVADELRRRELMRASARAERIMFEFAAVWEEQPLEWRVEALKWIADKRDLSDIQAALNVAMK